jgi:5-methylcytosine-specific restriction protein A
LQTLQKGKLDAEYMVTPNGATPDERRISLWRRRKALRTSVLDRANGRCEGCQQAAPFVTANDAPYLELHFLRRETDVGLDDASFVAAVCPNCHKRLHLGKDAPQFREIVSNGLAASGR